MKVIDGGFGKDDDKEFDNVDPGVIGALNVAMTAVKDGNIKNCALILLSDDGTHTHIIGNYDGSVYALLGLMESCKSVILEHETG